jgi:hypothetical protein
VSPTALTLSKLRADGWTCQVVESWIPRINCRRDLFGVIDIVAVRRGQAPLAVQATSTANVSARIAKASREPRLRAWLGSGATFEVWGWGRRDGKWECRKTALTLDGLAGIRPMALTPRRRRKKLEPSLF